MRKQVAEVNQAPRTIGEIIVADYMRPKNMTVEQLAYGIGVTVNRAQQLITNNYAVNAQLAMRLAIFFDTSAHFWLYAQADYALTRIKTNGTVARLLPFYTPRDCADGYVVLVLSREAEVDQEKFDAVLDRLHNEKGIKQIAFSRSKTEMSAHAKRWAIENNVLRDEFIMNARHRISRTAGYLRDFEVAICHYRPDIILTASSPTWAGRQVVDSARRGGYRIEEVDVIISDLRAKQLEALRLQRTIKRHKVANRLR